MIIEANRVSATTSNFKGEYEVICNLILQRVLRCTHIPQGQIEGMHNTR